MRINICYYLFMKLLIKGLIKGILGFAAGFELIIALGFFMFSGEVSLLVKNLIGSLLFFWGFSNTDKWIESGRWKLIAVFIAAFIVGSIFFLL